MPANVLLQPEFLRRLQGLELALSRTYGGTLAGQHASRRLGGGLEFSDFRPYQGGDDYRYIDWNLYSRLGQLFLKRFIDDRDVQVHILVDCSRSMAFGDPGKLLTAQKLAAALGFIGLGRADRVGALGFGRGYWRPFALVRGRRSAVKLFHFLDTLVPGRQTGLNENLARFCRSQVLPGRGGGLAIVISDLLDAGGYEKGLLQLRHKGWQVLLVQLLDRSDYSPAEGGHVSLVDSETHRRQDVYLDQLALDTYRKRAALFLEQVKSFCGPYQINCVQAFTDSSLEALVHRCLQPRGGTLCSY